MPKAFRLVSTVALLASAFASAQTWRDRFDAMEWMVPMRDGTKLYTLAYIPKDKPGPFPIIMERTPYGAGSATQAPRRASPKMTEAGYIVAFQDVRGRNKSEGDFINVRPTLPAGVVGIDESTDTYDTVEFLIKNVPKNNGRVGLWGISYPGFYAGAGAIRNHPALKAVSPQAPVNEWFLGDDVHHNGVMFVQETFDFCIGFDVPRGQPRITVDRGDLSAYEFYLRAGALSNYEAKFLQGRLPYWTELMVNDTYNEYWKSRALWRSFKGVKCAVLTVGGWFDKEDMYGALKLYDAGEKQNPGQPNFLIMGPWSHGQWASGNGASLADLAFGSRTGQWFQENIEFPFFERYLRDRKDIPDVAEATMFETGVNAWRTYPAWPPKEAKAGSLFLAGDRTVTFTEPKTAGQATYVSDPANPTPYLADYLTSRRAPGDWLARDQRFAGLRPDTVTFASAPLTADMRIGGPVEADLWISTTGTDCDLVVSLIDEYPAETADKNPAGGSMAGYQYMVRGNIMRAKFRESFEKPVPLVPGKPTRVRWQLNDALHTFRKGHRILIRVQSSWFPIAERNPNQFLSRVQARDEDFKRATINVLFGPRTPSQVRVGLMPAAPPAPANQ